MLFFKAYDSVIPTVLGQEELATGVESGDGSSSSSSSEVINSNEAIEQTGVTSDQASDQVSSISSSSAQSLDTLTGWVLTLIVLYFPL
jgi:hypothetical protein